MALAAIKRGIKISRLVQSNSWPKVCAFQRIAHCYFIASEQNAEPEREWRLGFRVKSARLGATPAGLAWSLGLSGSDMAKITNPVLRAAIMEIVHNQLRDSTPPEVRRTRELLEAAAAGK